jgi:phosphorylcholine metabolism protein LicD
LVEIELLQENVKQLKDILMQEASQKEEKKNMKYMDKLEKDIRKMLIIARKKQVERDRMKKQEEEDHLISINPEVIDSTPDSVLIETKSLPSLLKR